MQFGLYNQVDTVLFMYTTCIVTIIFSCYKVINILMHLAIVVLQLLYICLPPITSFKSSVVLHNVLE